MKIYKKIDLTIKPAFAQEYRDGYPLISKESIVNLSSIKEEGVILNFLDSKGKFIAKGYHGIQNKGFGWVLSLNKNEQIDKDYFAKKIKTALTCRDNFFDSKHTTAFRVFNGEGDGIGGLTIDYFDGYYMLTWYSKGIYEFKDDILEALKMNVEYKGIYEKKRFDTKGMYLDNEDDFVCGEKADAPIIVKENGVNFAIYLDDGAMVGVFLDQRDVRKAIKEKYSNGKTMLNTFSYTGAFSVFASLGGATKTTSVDLAKRSRPKTSEQFSINEIDPQSQDIIVEDVFNYFKYAVRKNLLFDLVVLDPPSFARSKKHTFSASKDYVKLLKEAIQITSKYGVIVASTNSANLLISTHIALEKDVNIFVEYFNCINFRSKSKIVRELLAKYTHGSGRGFSDDEALKLILTQLIREKGYMLLVIDEIHLLKSEEILAFLDIAETYGHQNAKLSILLISRNRDWMRIETERILSRLNEKITLKPYKFDDAKQILEYRSEEAFKEYVISDDILDMISQIVADHENMRHGIEILRKSGLYADKHNLSSVNAEIIREASNEVYPTFRGDIIDQLNDQELLALYGISRSLINYKEPFTLVDDAFEEYQIICETYSIEPHVKMSFRKYIRQLNQLEIISSKTVRIEEAERGRHLEITLLDIPAVKLEEFLIDIFNRKFE